MYNCYLRLSIIFLLGLLCSCTQSEITPPHLLDKFVGDWSASPICPEHKVAIDINISILPDSTNYLDFIFMFNRRQAKPMIGKVINDRSFILDTLRMNGNAYYGNGTIINDEMEMELDFNVISLDTILTECNLVFTKS